MSEQTFNKPMMASNIIAAFSDPKRGIKGFQKGKIAKGMARKVQTKLATAQKFVISNKLIDHIAEASMVKPDAMLEMIKTAIPPFPNMFIEWDCSYQVEAFARVYKKYYPEVEFMDDNPLIRPGSVGYHISKQDGWDNSYSYEQYFYDNEWNQYASCPNCINIVNDENWSVEDYCLTIEHSMKDMPAKSKEELLPQKNKLEMMRRTGLIMFGYGYDQAHKKEDNKDLIYSRVFVSQSSAMHWYVPEQKFKEGYTSEEMDKLGAMSAQVLHGDARFLVTALAMLNYDYIITEKKTPSTQKVNHIAFGRRVPANEYGVLTIDLPKPKGKKIYEREFSGHGSPKKEHWRSGHWRRYRDRFGNVTKRKWIDAQKVGDKNLGTKIKDYELNKANGE